MEEIKKIVGGLLLVSMLFFAQNNESLGQQFKAGASITDITPHLGHPIVGNYNSPPATYIHDPLSVRTLVLDDGAKELVFVIVDNVHINREVFDAAKAILDRDLNIPAKDVMMASTHTHSGISLNGGGLKTISPEVGVALDEYQTFAVKRMVDGVKIARENKTLAKIAFGSVDVPEHVFNRRWIMKDSVMNPLGQLEIAKMNPGHSNDLLRPAGPVDPEVAFIAVESQEGTPIALLANYSLHYVGGVPKGHISADYFAAFGNIMGELLGADANTPAFVGIMTNGTSGDVNNNDYSRPRPTEAVPPYEKIQYVANDVANKVHHKYKELDFQSEVKLGSALSEMTLTVRRASPEILKNVALVRDYNGSEPLFHKLEKTYAKRVFNMESSYPDSVQIVLQSFAINDIGIASIPFEVFAQIGLDIKEQSPFKNTFTIELANGSYGYLPTPAQHQLGGYESWLTTNRVQKDASDKITSELIKHLNQLK
ncbi:neutral/alkaline non-lysosomal ceramidase N-terminal domain-containing protein [Cyclobacterium marinum]|uniref:Neutral/alkaline non-lysosomal ceramidase N-terminal domain-containing protein n=1 Tax=Cyclobacterium marinum (strain ATCC 25205 / DSM 745 / LMG 13164 / NCIMB 1802) TaxID=880070 RepID=G0IZG2_CYCMS|nr:neutral/alkaline non-lysosomal ceramidase N-terminal domain-containing protein [Cyclobacterium marinum]AEL25003.1 hypothetical protein Cycma_1231 [Cyclobacterium marinum DSM 745]